MGVDPLSLKKIGHVGESHQGDTSFDWPSEELLKGFKLNKSTLPKLAQVRTKGSEKNGLTAIQLVFDDRMTSPWLGG